MTSPSAFTDSPEDLVARAEAMIKDEGVPAKAGVLIADLARSLRTERGARASNFAMLKAHNIDMGVQQDEIKRLTKALEAAEETRHFKTCAEAVAVAKDKARRAHLVAAACAVVSVVLAIAHWLR